MPADDEQGKKIKFLFVFLGLVLVGELIWAVYYLTDPLKFFRGQPTPSPPLLAADNKAFLFLDPPLGEFNRGAPVELKIVLDSRANLVLGTDVVLRFDPNFWEIIDGDLRAGGIQIVPGTIFPRHLGNKVNLSQGKITFSGLAEVDQPFSGRGILAKIELVPKKKGTTKIFFDYQPGATNDSNVAGMGAKDLLDKAVGGEYIIK